MVHEGDTGHIEVVEVEYDPSVISYEQLLKVFWHGHNPTQWNYQGPDIGTQYRSAIFYHNEAQRKAALKSYRELTEARVYRAPIVTLLLPMKAFYRAEEYHQNYYGGKPDQPVVRSSRSRRAARAATKGRAAAARASATKKEAAASKPGGDQGADPARTGTPVDRDPRSGALRMETRTWIVDGVRTPMGAMNGVLASLPAPRLGAACIEALLRRTSLDGSRVNEVIMGNVIGAGLGQNPARQAALFAGVPESVGATTVSKVCGSGLKAIMLADQAIRLGEAGIVVAGGMESMSRARTCCCGRAKATAWATAS